MNWKTHFNAAVRLAGKLLCSTDRVRHMTEEPEKVYRATVEAPLEEPCRVYADLSTPGRLGLGCTCQDGKDKKLCRHMAALLYAIEDEDSVIDDGLSEALRRSREGGRETSARDERGASPADLPFDLEEPRPITLEEGTYLDSYRYFDLAALLQSCAYSAAEMTSARRMISRGEFVLDHVETTYDEGLSPEMIGVIYGTQNPGTPRAATCMLKFDRTRLIAKQCTVYSCKGYYYGFERDLLGAPGAGTPRLCVHDLALLLLLQTYLQDHSLGDATSSRGMDLLERYRRPASGAVSAAGPGEDTLSTASPLLLEPRVFFPEDEGALGVEFRTGVKKLYLIRSLEDFYDCAEEGGTWQLGKNAQIDFSAHRFDARSASYYTFLRSVIAGVKTQRTRMVRPWGPGFAAPRVGRELILTGDLLDAFFTAANGLSCPLRAGGKDASITFTERDLKITLRTAPLLGQGRVFLGIRVTAEIPAVIKGIDYLYWHEVTGGDNHHFCRMSREVTSLLRPLFDAAGEDGLDFTVGRSRLSDFYYRLLPKLGDHVRLIEETPELIRRYLPPRAAFRFFLDADPDRIACAAQVLYGEEAFPLTPEPGAPGAAAAFRDLQAEEAARESVLALFPVYEPGEQTFATERSADAVFEILENGVSRLMELGEVHTTDQFLRLRVRSRFGLKIGVSVENDLLSLDVLSDEVSPEELLELLASFRKKKRYHRLRNGDFLRLDGNDTVEALAEMLDTLHVSPKEFVKGKMQIPAYRALYLDRMLEDHDEILAQRDTRFRTLARNFRTVQDTDHEVPASLAPVMRGYQKYGFKWLMTVKEGGFGGILADEMGLGKTIQMIAVLLAQKEQTGSVNALIVCPASLVYNWQEEIRRFAPALKAVPVTGTKRERLAILDARTEADVLITSYDLLKRDIADYDEIPFSFVILDEAQYIKNAASAAAKSVKILKAAHRFALTGTPIENRLSELWSIFDFLMPGFFYAYDTFRKEIEAPVTQHHDELASARLRKMVSPFILRRLKADVLRDLPDKLEETRYAVFDKQQQQLYDAQVVHMKKLLGMASGQDFQKHRMQILAELTRLRQICCDPALLADNYTGESAKRAMLMETIREAMDSGHRMLVFSQFTSMLDLIRKDLEAENIPYYLITGATPGEERQRLVSEFNEGDVPVFLISLRAGGTGLNLTGADVVIHYDPWWNLAVQNQATDRAHRIGQTKIVTVLRLIARGTIEDKILHIQEAKRELAEEILSGETGTLGRLSREELLDLLQ